MAFFDDPRFLLSHIRHSFITCDDTGMCEMVMLNDVIAEPLKQDSNMSRGRRRKLRSEGDPQVVPEVDEEEVEDDEVDGIEEEKLQPDLYPSALDSELLEMGQSYEIMSDMELIGAHRRRSNTAQRLERLKKERRNQAKVKHVMWKEASKPMTETEIEAFFPKKELVTLRHCRPSDQAGGADGCPEHRLTEEDSAPKRVSALALQLEKFPAAPNNPFNEYARFDGEVTGAQTKKINIFLMMLPPNDRSYPMVVVTLSSARVQDLIGLVCWQYTNEGREPKLKPSVGNYCLRIAEETGEVDEDFPSLDPKEPISKFGFPYLALMESEKLEETGPLVTFHTTEGFSKVQVPNLEVTMREVLDQLLKRRKGLLGSLGPEFHVEKQHELGVPVDLDGTLKDTGTLEFVLVSEDVSIVSSQFSEWAERDMIAMEAPLYQIFTVSMIQRLGKNTNVQLGISGEKIEITPLPQKGTAKLWSWHQKAVTHNVNEIAACEIVHRKQSSGKLVFKIVYLSGGDFKNHVFDAESRVATDIVRKLNFILEMRTSSAHQEYKSIKERKLLRKQQSFVNLH